MTVLCQQETAAVEAAAEWLSTSPRDRSRPVIPLLRERFGLSTLEAVEAVREANLRRVRAA